MQRRLVHRTDPHYRRLRSQNNTSVKRSREKSRRQRDETVESINQLEQDNQHLIQNLQKLTQEYEQLQNLFKQHTGIDIDQMISTESKPTKELPVQTKENPAKPVLTINTTEEKSPLVAELDANNLDGSIVLINGVQYKIVSMNQT